MHNALSRLFFVDEPPHHVIFVPTGHHHHHKPAGVDARAGDPRPPIPQLVTEGEGVGIGKVFDGVINDEHVRPFAR